MLQYFKIKNAVTILFLSASSLVFSQIQADLYTSISEDSLHLFLSKIDSATDSDLQKLREAFTYRNRVAPSDQNKRILEYVQKTIAIRKPD